MVIENGIWKRTNSNLKDDQNVDQRFGKNSNDDQFLCIQLCIDFNYSTDDQCLGDKNYTNIYGYSTKLVTTTLTLLIA